MADFGYAGEILKIDLADGRVTRLPTADYADRFLGGRGIAARLYWDTVPPEAKAFDPENCLIYITGPVTGFNRLAGCRWQVCGKAPVMEPEAFSYANLGERWGSYLKYAGYDGLVVQGKADKPVYIYIHNGAIEIRDASSLWGKPAFEACDSLKEEMGKGASVLTIGPAAENLMELVDITNQELDSNMQSYQAELDSISRAVSDTNQCLGRLYDAIETGKIGLDDLVDRIRELRQQQEHLQARRIDIETQMSDKKVELVDLNLMTDYVTEMQEILRNSSLTERRAFIRSFVQEIKVTGNEVLMTYSPPIPPDKLALSGDTVPRIVHHGGR